MHSDAQKGREVEVEAGSKNTGGESYVGMTDDHVSPCIALLGSTTLQKELKEKGFCLKQTEDRECREAERQRLRFQKQWR